MREMLGATSALMALASAKPARLSLTVAFLAPPRSGIGYVTPEAARGGVIAVVADGDRIEIDLNARKLDLDVSEAEIGCAGTPT